MGLSQGKLLKPVNLRKSLKSTYILKNIFSLLTEKKKLTIISYNKKYQANLDISIENFKSICIKYIIGEKNGQAKEYDKKDRLIFEGEYLNWKRNGYGKEYKKEKLLFEGEFSKGERSGKGKEYNKWEELIFEGEYLNGERNGKGKEYYPNGNLKFEGEYLNGKRNGNGKRYGNKQKLFKEGSIKFEGKYLNGKKIQGTGYDWKGRIILKIEKNGKINYYYFNGTKKFEGQYLDNERNGIGKEYYKNGKIKFEGEYLKGERNGNIQKYNSDGD